MLLVTLLVLLIFAMVIGLLFAVGELVLRILYICCIGFPIAVCIGLAGVICCITLIGIPVGMLLFRAAGFVLHPFR